MLEPLARVTNVETWIDPSANSVVLMTADQLAAEQLARVNPLAWPEVRVERSLSTPRPNLPLVPMARRPLSVGEDLRSLLVCYSPVLL